MRDELRELWDYRELLFSMVQRDLRVRYKNSIIGFLWSFVNPLVTTLVMTVVFKVFMKINVPNYSAYILTAYLPFMFMQSSILDSAQSILNAYPIIKKTYFPREILPLSSVISNFIHLLAGFCVLFAYLLVVYIRNPQEMPIQITVVWMPLLLAISFTFTLGVSLLISALNTFYEDVKYVMSVVMYLMLFLCPVMYFVEMVANSQINHQPYFWVYKLYNLNPIAALCIAFRKTILAPVKIPAGNNTFYPIEALHWKYVAASGVTSVFFLVLGYAVFNRLKWKFAERP